MQLFVNNLHHDYNVSPKHCVGCGRLGCVSVCGLSRPVIPHLFLPHLPVFLICTKTGKCEAHLSGIFSNPEPAQKIAASRAQRAPTYSTG